MADGIAQLDVRKRDRSGYLEKRFSVDEFFVLADNGFFDDAMHYELWDGQIVMTPPPGQLHGHSEARLAKRLILAIDAVDPESRSYVAQPGPGLQVNTDTFVRPDFAVVTPVDPANVARLRPEHVLHCIEVSNSTLDQDIHRKSRTYATVEISEYWIVDTVNGKLHIFRSPARGEYSDVSSHGPGQSVSPLFEPRIEIAVGDLF